MLWTPPRRDLRPLGPASFARHRTCRRPAAPRTVRPGGQPVAAGGRAARTSAPAQGAGGHHDETHAGGHLEEVVTVVAAPGLWAAVVAMAPASPARGLVLAAGWFGIATVLGRRRGDT